MLHEAVLSLLGKAGFDVLFPPELASLCCGLTFESARASSSSPTRRRRELERALPARRATVARCPSLFDTSPCLYRMKGSLDPGSASYEPIEFIHAHLMDKLRFERRRETVAIHVTCSVHKMGLEPASTRSPGVRRTGRRARARAAAASRATGVQHARAERVGARRPPPGAPADCKTGYSNSRTCEIGLSLHGGIPYQSIVYLVDRCTSPQLTPP